MDFQRGGGMGDGESEDPFINVIPLIDVIMVILIFLMLTTTFSKVSSLDIDLPKGAETSDQQSRRKTSSFPFPPKARSSSIAVRWVARRMYRPSGAKFRAPCARTIPTRSSSSVQTPKPRTSG